MLLRNKARRLRKETGNERYYAPLEKINKSVLSTVGHALTFPFELLIWEAMCLCLDVYSAFLLGVIYLFFGVIPLVFENNHGFNLWQVGFAFMGLFVGISLSASTFPLQHRFRMRLIRRREKATGEPDVSEPEYRLPSVMIGAVLIPIGLFWFGWTSFSSVHWIVPIMGSAVFAFA